MKWLLGSVLAICLLCFVIAAVVADVLARLPFAG